MDPILAYYSLDELLTQAEQLLLRPATTDTLADVQAIRREVEYRRATLRTRDGA